MKESIGYTVTLNIVITFIIIVFAFLSAALIYFKSNKVSNVITDAIEKYEGFNDLSITEINSKMTSLGYSSKSINCGSFVEDKGAIGEKCDLKEIDGANPGFCVYLCKDVNDSKYYYYKIKTNMMINIPIINDLLDIPIYSTTNRMYDFSDELNENKNIG